MKCLADLVYYNSAFKNLMGTDYNPVVDSVIRTIIFVISNNLTDKKEECLVTLYSLSPGDDFEQVFDKFFVKEEGDASL